MTDKPVYIIDSNILIESKNLDYGFDICPGFWELMRKAFESGLVISHKKVLEEIKQYPDEICVWVQDISPSAFPKETVEEFEIYRELCNWAVSQSYKQAAVDKFCANDYADPWICAKAKAMNLILVTQEVSAPEAKREVKLPDACRFIGVPCINKYELMRKLQARFCLDPEHSFEQQRHSS